MFEKKWLNLDTDLTPEACVEQLKFLVGSGSLDATHKPFAGYVKPTVLAIRNTYHYRNFIRPEYFARIESEQSGTRLSGYFHIPLLSKFCLWLPALVPASLWLNVVIEQGLNAALVLQYPMLLVACSPLLVILVGYHLTRDEQYIKDHLINALDARESPRGREG